MTNGNGSNNNNTALTDLSAVNGMTMEKLVEKEREVAQRMQSLKERQQTVAAALASLQPNWPRHCLCIGPIVYHDIDMAIPEDRKRFAKFSYTNYFATIFFLLYNLVVAIAALGAPNKGSIGKNTSDKFGMHLGIAVPIFLLGMPGAFLVWHFQIYQAIQPQSQTVRKGFGLAFLGLGLALLFDILMAVGIPGYGGCGWVYAATLKSQKQNPVPAIMCVISAVFWTLQALSFVWMFMKLRGYYKADAPAKK